MSRDWSKPSASARWGWGWAALQALLVAWNLCCLALGVGSGWNWVAAGISAVCFVICLALWRDVVRTDRTHRAFMAAWDRKWGITR